MERSAVHSSLFNGTVDTVPNTEIRNEKEKNINRRSALIVVANMANAANERHDARRQRININSIAYQRSVESVEPPLS